jgi:hypothetical protein
MVPTGAEAAIRSPHDDQGAEALFLGVQSLSRVRSALTVGLPKQRRNRVDRSMGSGDRLV